MTSEGRQVTHQPERSRFACYFGDREAGELVYQLDGDVFTALHTGVPPEFEGNGIGAQLAEAAMRHARTQGYTVLPRCWYVRDWLARHDDFLDLVPAAQRARFGLPG